MEQTKKTDGPGGAGSRHGRVVCRKDSEAQQPGLACDTSPKMPCNSRRQAICLLRFISLKRDRTTGVAGENEGKGPGAEESSRSVGMQAEVEGRDAPFWPPDERRATIHILGVGMDGTRIGRRAKRPLVMLILGRGRRRVKSKILLAGCWVLGCALTEDKY